MASLYRPPRAFSDAHPQVMITPLRHELSFLYSFVIRRIVNWRTIVVFIDGACSNNGYSGAQGGIGVWFGEGSEYNVSERIYGEQTNQRAEILAAVRALEVVRDDVVRRYGGRLNRVILASDSKYVVNAMTDWIKKWRNNGWRNAKGFEVTNREDFERLDRLIDVLNDEEGIRVQFWSVGREDNEDADALARSAARSEMVLYY